MSLEQQLVNVVTRMATESKALRTLINGNAANLNALTTTEKGNLVAALNDLQSQLNVVVANAGATISDSSTATSSTWSSSKINTQINAAVSNLVNGSPAALDTLKELSDALGGNASFATDITTALGNRVRTDVNTQNLTETQKGNARTNLDVYSKTEVDTKLGDTERDLVAVYTAGLSS